MTANAERVAVDDLRFAADWLEAYDDEHDTGEGTAAARRVAAFLRREAARRAEDAAVSDVQRRMARDGRPVTRGQARAAVRRAADSV